MSGAFTGESTPTISAGKGSFTVARSGSTTSTIYTVTLTGYHAPVAQSMVVLATVEDPALTGATDAFLVNVKEKSATNGTFVLQARDVAGTVAAMQDAAIVNFVVYLHTAVDRLV